MMAELDEKVSCQVIMKDAKLLMVKSGDDCAKLWWKERLLLRFLWVYEATTRGSKVTKITDGFAQW